MKNKQENMHPSMINAKIDENPDIREDSIKNNAFLNNPSIQILAINDLFEGLISWRLWGLLGSSIFTRSILADIKYGCVGWDS